MGRPRKEELDKKTVICTIRMTPKEANEVELQAELAGLSVSELLRRRALKRPVVSVVDLKTIAELRRIGGLVKMIYSESKGMYSRQTSAILDELQATVATVRKRMSRDS